LSIDIRGVCPLLSVFDMPRSIRFYRDLLGLELVENSKTFRGIPDNFGWAMLRLNGAEVMLNSAYEPDDPLPDPAPTQFVNHGDTCLYFGCPDVDAAYQYLLGQGLELKPPKVAWYGMKQLYVNDPDGYGLCFQWKA
jgi:catechol 2,3-dioxygenase-like lactoylglutathione lyase family enzyme